MANVTHRSAGTFGTTLWIFICITWHFVYCYIHTFQTAGTKKPDSAEHKEVILEEDDIFSSGGEVSKSKSKKYKKKCKDMPEPLITSPSEAAKSSDPSAFSETPKLGKFGWFRRRASSDSKALKSKSTCMFAVIIKVLVVVRFLFADKSTTPSEIKYTPVSPENSEESLTVGKSSFTGSDTKGIVKMLSAHFEALDKPAENQHVAEGRWIVCEYAIIIEL